MRAHGRRVHPLVLVVGAVIAANLVVAGVDRLAGGTGGPRSSSYATAPDGLAAYADLLARSNHPVIRLRSSLAENSPSPAGTLVVLDPPELAPAEARAVRTFLAAGGRLVIGGRGPHPWLPEIFDDPPEWTGGGVHEAGMIAPAPEVAGLTAVRAGAEGYWSDSGASLPALGRGAKSIVNVTAAGRGRAVLLADASILHNGFLARAENAALGLRLAGEAGRPVTFVESVHGYGSATGIGALPRSWRAAGAVGMLAALVLLWARGRRLGPPEDDARPLPPPRRDYVVSLAGALARTQRPAEAVAPLQAAAHRRLARSIGLGADADEAALRAAAAARGLPEGLTAALFRPATSEADVLSVGRATAWLHQGPVPRGVALKELRDLLAAEVRKAVVGQDESVELLLAACLVGGHVLLEGVPGVAKTLLAHACARALGASFRRVQFTPDMLPSDLTGTMALRHGELMFRPGPVFTNVLLADEINRTPPKTQAALLEAMQERQVSVDGEPHPLPDPFLVVATQNPIEYEGTYPLPEAQLDRFVFKLDITYPSEADEVALLRLARRGVAPEGISEVAAVCGRADFERARREIDATTVSDEVVGYVAALVRRTRTLPSVVVGASPRAAVHLVAAAKASARLDQRDYVTPDDVARMAPFVLRHRLVLSPEAELERYRPDDAVRAALGAVEVPR